MPMKGLKIIPAVKITTLEDYNIVVQVHTKLQENLLISTCSFHSYNRNDSEICEENVCNTLLLL